MLTGSNYLIRAGFDPAGKVDVYEIVDAETEAVVGRAREREPKAWVKRLRGAVGRNFFPTVLRVHDTERGALVFSIRELNTLWDSRLEVIDAAGQALCEFKGRFATVGGGFLILDGAGRLMGELENETGTWRYQVRGRDGHEVGTIQEQVLSSKEQTGWSESYSVRVNASGQESRAARLLMLAAALAMDLVYRDRV